MRLILFLSFFCFFLSCGEIDSPQKEKKDLSTRDTGYVMSDSLVSLVETPIHKKVTLTLPPIDYDTTQWIELIRLDSTIIIDLKYATLDNFVGEKMYECGRCFLRPEVAVTLYKIHQVFREKGLGLKMLDCYRPHPIQWKLWKKFPNPRYVTNPEKGSMHNRGKAVDLTLVDATGKELDMGTEFDYFGIEAHSNYDKLPEEVIRNRKLLKEAMLAHNFKGIRTEWWHFSYQGKAYSLSDMLWKCY